MRALRGSTTRNVSDHEAHRAAVRCFDAQMIALLRAAQDLEIGVAMTLDHAVTEPVVFDEVTTLVPLSTPIGFSCASGTPNGLPCQRPSTRIW
jgi:hypothetical protein